MWRAVHGGRRLLVDRRLANTTGSVGANGPLVYDIPSDGSGLGSRIADAMGELVATNAADITATVIDDPSDDIDAVAAFVDGVIPNNTASGECATGLNVIDSNSDGKNDTFLDVPMGAHVCFDLVPLANTTVQATSERQLAMATILIWGDHVTVLAEHDVYFVIPAL